MSRPRSTNHRTRHSLFSVWESMHQRCSNPKTEKHKRLYHDRGIRVCERWRDFRTFVADVGERPSPIHTLDRIDNEKGYEPGNVRWATPTEQNRNRRDNLVVAYQGETRCLIEWSELMGINYQTLRYRYNRGKREEELFSKIVRNTYRPKRQNA